MRLHRIVSTLKSSGRGTKEEKTGRQERPSGSRFPDRGRWHEDVKRCGDVLEHVFNGRPLDLNRILSLNKPTSQYLTALDPNLIQPSHDCDQILITLLDEHAANDSPTLCVAVLTCLHSLSPSIAAKYLLSLASLNIDRYLRCIQLTSQIRPDVISTAEVKVSKLLLLLVTGRAQGLREFGQLFQSLVLCRTSKYLPLQTIHEALIKSGIRPRLQSHIHSHLKQQLFKTAYELVSWLPIVTNLQYNSDLVALLDAHFPDWVWLAIWKPNVYRINVWQHGKINESQRQKLSHVLELDGPDVETCQLTSLRLVEPRCYQGIKLDPENQDNLENFLDLVYRACLVGTSAIDLIIQHVGGNIISTKIFSMIDDAVKTGDEGACKSIVDFSRTLEPHISLTEDVQAFIDFLSSKEQLHRVPHESLMDQLADRLCHVMQLAQAEFRKQLRKGLPGDYMGMLVYELGVAIQQSSRIHSNLPPDFLEKIRQFPQQQTLDTLFDELQDDSENSAAHSSRFRSYLLSSLGGEGLLDSGALKAADVQEEIKFWKRHPDQPRKDLAKMLGEIPDLDYSLYTTCLHAMFKEHDLYISQMKGNISSDDEESGLKFATYLAYRRKLNQMQNPCWLFLTAALLKSQKNSLLPRMADSTSFVEWDKLVGDLELLLDPIQDQLPASGSGLTKERLSWWKKLSKYAVAVKFLLETHGQQRSLRWLYFPTSSDHVMPLLEVASQPESMSSLNRQIISYLRRSGKNAVEVCDCIRLLVDTSSLGRAVCERFLSKEEERWGKPNLRTAYIAWIGHKSLTDADRSALDSVRALLQIHLYPTLLHEQVRSTNELLQSEFDSLFQAARQLESSRLRLQHKDPRRVSTVLSQIGVDSTSTGRIADEQIPDELVDAIDEVGESEFELSFSLTGLNNLQRQARGIHTSSRMLLVRVSLLREPQFCIHFSPNDEGQDPHRQYRSKSQMAPEIICSTKPNLFTYFVGRHLYYLFRKGQPSLQELYNSIQSLISAHPTTCLVCSNAIGTNLWKPASCSMVCSVSLRRAPLEVRLHNLLVDPAAFDLLLTCVYAAAADTTNLDLLPGCPVKKDRIATVIDSMPVLTTYQTAHNLKSAIQGNDGLGKQREDLLSWLCLKFRGFLLSAQGSSRVPSMPNTQQFLLLNSHHEREALFNAKTAASGTGRVIFHGTQVSRMLLILTEGLKVKSGTPFMLTGAARGNGIYCGDDQATSLNYSGGTGTSWKNSSIRNMRIMLGCELATTAPSANGSYHVVTDENSLMVRYVFLLPLTYQCPPRHHVEPAMSITYANLRAGTLV